MSRRPKTTNLLGNVHMAGEFFVAAELSKRGYLMSLDGAGVPVRRSAVISHSVCPGSRFPMLPDMSHYQSALAQLGRRPPGQGGPQRNRARPTDHRRERLIRHQGALSRVAA
jgi:hypothetical protein